MRSFPSSLLVESVVDTGVIQTDGEIKAQDAGSGGSRGLSHREGAFLLPMGNRRASFEALL
jgi:hypothetical protein